MYEGLNALVADGSFKDPHRNNRRLFTLSGTSRQISAVVGSGLLSYFGNLAREDNPDHERKVSVYINSADVAAFRAAGLAVV